MAGAVLLRYSNMAVSELTLSWSAWKPDAEIERIWARKRWAADDEIDHLVYKLHELIDDEIAIVEEAKQRAK